LPPGAGVTRLIWQGGFLRRGILLFLHHDGMNIPMSKVIAIMSMSLDGYVANLNDGVAEVFDWYFTSGDVGITHLRYPVRKA